MKAKDGILNFMTTFPDEESCIRYLEKLRWGDKVVSPFDASSKVYKCANGKYKCRNSGKYFDVKTGTVFAGTKIALRSWIFAIFLFMSHKRGISSCQLARDLGITQKTAWNMLHKIRIFMELQNNRQVSGEVEIDETFVGGKNKNRHKDKKVAKCQGRSFKDKVPVFGMLQRNGHVSAIVVPDTKASTLKPLINKFIKEDSTVFTDGWEYSGLENHYRQFSVDHGRHFYGETITTCNGERIEISTNGIENVWSHFKRMIFGTYYKVSKKHLQRYVDEFIFRFNTRKYSEIERFELFLQCIA
ncbi:MAG: IS1595 family transposase [Muribaculaceae bacterium]|nr:IS1595 family transposase [Muribaculaceae bacterium]